MSPGTLSLSLESLLCPGQAKGCLLKFLDPGTCPFGLHLNSFVQCRGPTGTALNELADLSMNHTNCDIILVSLVPPAGLCLPRSIVTLLQRERCFLHAFLFRTYQPRATGDQPLENFAP